MAQSLDHGGARDFDFLIGRWSVRHRKLRERLRGSDEWFEFPGTLHVVPILGGLGNVDDNELFDPDGEYVATSLRVFRPADGKWSVYWIDGIDTPCIGVFAGKVGKFYADDEFEGRSIKLRFTYRDISPMEACWDQAFSADGGQSWETNWVMEFTRAEEPA